MSDASRPAVARARFPSLHAVSLAAVLVAGMALRVASLGAPSFGFDELYHVLVARSLLAGEGLELSSGRPYPRAAFVSVTTAAAFALFGESEWSARLPSVAFGAVSLVLVYRLACSLFGPTAGLVAAALLALSPHAIDADRFARMYSPLTTAGLAGLLASYRFVGALGAARSRGRATVAWGAAAVGSAALMAHLHLVGLTLVPVVQAYAALLGGVALVAARRRSPDERSSCLREAGRYGLLVVVLLAAELAAAFVPAVRERLWAAARVPLVWYRPAPDDPAFYHWHLTGEYGWLWALVWPATVLLVVARPRQGLLLALAFWLPFALVSGVVVTKSPRYIVHLLPFAWLILAGAAGVTWPVLRERLDARVAAWLPRAGPAARAAVASAMLLAVALPVARTTPSVIAALRRPARTTGSLTTGYFADWRALAAALDGRLEPDALVVSSVPYAARYYLGRPAFHLVGARQRREAGDREPPQRPGMQLQRAEDLDALRGQGRLVWVLIERFRWDVPGKLDAALKAALVASCRRDPLDESLALVAFACPPA